MTHTNAHHRLIGRAGDERGMALLLAVIVLLLMSALGLAALQHSGDEASGSGRARRKDATLYAAESGLKMLQVKFVTAASPETGAFISEPTLVQDGFGNPIHVVSGAPQNGTLPTPQTILADPNYPGEQPEGYTLNENTAGKPIWRPVRADVTALDVANGMVHVQAQLKVYEGSE